MTSPKRLSEFLRTHPMRAWPPPESTKLVLGYEPMSWREVERKPSSASGWVWSQTGKEAIPAHWLPWPGRPGDEKVLQLIEHNEPRTDTGRVDLAAMIDWGWIWP